MADGEEYPKLKFPLVQVQGMSFQVVGNEFSEGILKVKERMHTLYVKYGHWSILVKCSTSCLEECTDGAIDGIL